MGSKPLGGGFSKGSYPAFTQLSEKTMENSERLGRQARPGIEPDTSRLPILNADLHSHWCGQGRTVQHPCLTRDSNREPLV